jgi:hypothetical protein
MPKIEWDLLGEPLAEFVLLDEHGAELGRAKVNVRGEVEQPINVTVAGTLTHFLAVYKTGEMAVIPCEGGKA